MVILREKINRCRNVFVHIFIFRKINFENLKIKSVFCHFLKLGTNF